MNRTSPVIYLFVLFFIAQTVKSQDFSNKFKVIGAPELNFSIYEKDPEAEAVILFDIGKSIFKDNTYNILFTRTKRIKILKRTGVKYADVSIPFYVDGYGQTEIVKSIEAYTYNFENGQLIKTPLDKKTIFEEKISNNWWVKKFVFPSVKKGSIIEFKYVLETPFHFNLPDWSFQDRIPTIYSQYTVNMVPFYEYVFLAQGITKFDYQKSVPGTITRTYGSVGKSYGRNVGSGFEFKDMIHTYRMENIPAFKDESYITSPEDYLMKIDFQLAKFHSPRGGTKEIISTWSKLAEDLLDEDNFGKYIRKSRRPVEDILSSEIETNGKDPAEKSKLIIDYVRSSFTWNGRYAKFTSKDPKEFVAEKTGNAADINLFLHALLKGAGIISKPVILSTRDHGKIKADYPFSHFFNYVLVLVNVNGQYFLADGTESMIAYNRIPPRCINEIGLIVDEENIGWVKLSDNIISQDSKRIAMNIDPEALVANAIISLSATELEAFVYKHEFNNDTLKLKEHLLDNGFTHVSKINTFNYKKSGKPYIIAVQGEASIEKLGDKLIISPYLDFPMKENKLTQEKRTYPVDLIYAKTENLLTTINIPEGFKVFSIPENYNKDDDLANINITYSQDDNIIKAKASYTLKKAVYQTDEYSRLRSYFDTIVKKFNEQIILEKL